MGKAPQQLGARDPDPELGQITTTLLPANWPQEIAKLPRDVLDLLQSREWAQEEPAVETRDGRARWVIRHANWADDDVRKPSLRLWNERLRSVQRVMAEKGFPTSEPLRVDPAEWAPELEEMAAFFRRFGARLPHELWDEHWNLRERLERGFA